jgi:hypothetical protein
MNGSRHLAELLAPDLAGPRISLYQPTHRSFPDNQQDPIRFRNLLKEIEASLGDKASAAGMAEALASLQAIAADEAFWSHALDGLAAFAAPGFIKVMRLQRPVQPVAIVADSFHVKPLLRILQSVGRFQVLALNRRSVRLYEGDRDVLDEIPLAEGVPRTADESSQADDATNQEGDKFFRAVDRAVTEHHSKPSGLPLILAALPEYHATFKGLSHNALLVDPAIAINPEALSADELRAKAWEWVLPTYEARLAGLVDRFGAARPTGKASDRLEDVALAAVEGRIDTLLVDAGRKIPGRLEASGSVVRGELDDASTDDLIDDMAESVLRAGGNVVVVPSERMPSTTGMAALLRY